ncbi:MAG: hypothetical protein QOJ78_790 [Pseudonocardiales bacterium]|nr:hypothetical protein [Pseudonocardiales bacterium]
MIKRTAVLVVPAALALAACSSSGTGGGGTSVTSTTPPVKGAESAVGSSSRTSDSSSSRDAIRLSALLRSGLADVKTAHVDLNVAIAGQSITGSGDEKLNNGKVEALRLTENLTGLGSLEIIITGGKNYAKLPGGLNKTGKPYVLLSPNSSDPTIKSLATSLESTKSSASLDSVINFVTAASSVKDAGTESVGSVATTHYTIVVDPTKLPSDFPQRSAIISSGLTSIPVELYLDGHGRPVLVTEKITVQGRSVSTKVTTSKYNQPVAITAPPASQVGTR